MASLGVSSLENGVVLGGERESSPVTEIGSPCWKIAETTTRNVLFRVWPTLIADKKRRDIIEYLQSLVRYYIGCEIFPYGSVPLKTYLPDGDIDLTAISPNIADAMLASDVYDVLRREEHNEAAQFKVKEVYRIDAEVKLVKCIVEDIVVDISFNQLGGLSALCFLEQIDQRMGNDHLFKRSIILIKAWCYYESRILGAHHGLISTYALEILVLHIFNVFHNSLEGPLSVLHTFLVYFSSFDWENYCISLKGPVGKSSRHDIVAEVPANEMDDPLLSEEFLRSCHEKFSVSSNALETKLQPFPLKYLNIIDPLKENNNLGRSVNRGNFCRIRSAFKLGAHKLGWILLLPTERMTDELNKFFVNTLDRNDSDCWKIVPQSVQIYGPKSSESLPHSSPSETFSEWEDIVESAGSFKLGPDIASALGKQPGRQLSQEVSSQLLLQLRCHLDEDVSKLLASGVIDARFTDDSICCTCGNRYSDTSISGLSHWVSHPCTQRYQDRNGKTDYWGSYEENLADYSMTNDETKFGFSVKHREKHAAIEEVACSCLKPAKTVFIGSIALVNVSHVPITMDNLEKNVAGIHGEGGALTLLLDLGGDYDSHFRNLHYGQLCHFYASSPTMCPPFLSLQQENFPWNTSCQSAQFPQAVDPRSCSQDGFGLRPQCFPKKSNRFSCADFREGNRRSRGTGTYLPTTHLSPCSNRRSPGGRRTAADRTRGQFNDSNDNLNMTQKEFPPSPQQKHELSQTEYLIPCNRDSVPSDSNQLNYPLGWDTLEDHVLSLLSEKHANAAFSCPLSTLATPVPEKDSGASPSQGSASSPLASVTKKCMPYRAVGKERVEEQSYHLKDEGDFPPLTV